jgi:hypothetical protein
MRHSGPADPRSDRCCHHVSRPRGALAGRWREKLIVPAVAQAVAVHVCIDDASRLAYGEVLPDECKTSAVPFLERALAWFAGQGVTVERVMTDNGSAYRSQDWRNACGALALRHIRTKPYTPRTNGRPSASARPACASGPMRGPL